MRRSYNQSKILTIKLTKTYENKTTQNICHTGTGKSLAEQPGGHQLIS